MVKKLIRINSICKQSELLAKFAQRAQLLERLNNTLHQILPLQFSAHCQLVNLNGNTLIFHTDNPSFASLIRFQTPALCRTFSKQIGFTIGHIEVKVRPSLLNTSQTPKASAKLSKTAATSLQQTAKIIDNPSLRVALEKLATRAKP